MNKEEDIMKYYILAGSMKPEKIPQGPEFKKILDAHHQYMAPYFASGKILTSGPLAQGRGGVILLRLEDEENIQDFIAADPFSQSGIQEYQVIQFNVFQIQDYAKEWTV
jgi:uncharacterized protein YciI